MIISTVTLTRQRVQLELAGSQETRLHQTPAMKKKVNINIEAQLLPWVTMATHPSPVASVVVAFEQTVNERTTAALDQRVGVP